MPQPAMHMSRRRGLPANRELDLRDIAELTQHLREVARLIRAIRDNSHVGYHVQLPKIPPALSESLAVLAIRQRLLLPWIEIRSYVGFGGREADVLVGVGDGSHLRIEVKSSGPQRFATFGAKDYAADFLIWFAFDDFFQRDDADMVDAFVFPTPARFLPGGWRPNRLTLSQLLANWPESGMRQTKIAFGTDGLKAMPS